MYLFNNVYKPMYVCMCVSVQVKAYIGKVREAGGVVNSSIVIAAGTGMVAKKDSTLLAINEGPISLKKA